MKRIVHAVATLAFIALPVVTCGCAGAGAVTSQQAKAAMTRLHFMAGSWTCVIRGGQSEGLVDNPTYRFVAGGTWMEEYSDMGKPDSPYSSVQMWGYDGGSKSLVAYQFMGAGVATKNVDGWQNGIFVSHRDDNGATVSIQRKGPRAFDWVITPKGGGLTVREVCTR